MRHPPTGVFTPRRAGRGNLARGCACLLAGLTAAMGAVDPASVPSRAPDAPVATNALPGVQSLLTYLHSISGAKILSGQQEVVNWDGTQNEVDFNRVTALTGKTPAVRGFDLMFYTEGPTGMGNTLQRVPARMIDWVRNRKGIATLCLHWKAGAGNSFNAKDTDFDLQVALDQPDSAFGREFRVELERIAVQLEQLRDAGISVIWRPFHECNGNATGSSGAGAWFWWGAKGAAVFKRAWRHMFDQFDRVHRLNNLIWCFNPTEASGAIEAWYPGDAFVDVCSIDHYPSSHTATSAVYERFQRVTGGRKVIGMSENGKLPDASAIFTAGPEFAPWVWFCTWNGFLTAGNGNPDDYIRSVYASDKVLTLERLPDVYGLSAVADSTPPPDLGVPPGTSRLTNLSVRSTAGAGGDALIVGFTIDGGPGKKVLLRAVGPTLGDFGVGGVLADPVLTLFSGSSQIAANDDWGAADGFAQIKDTANRLAAFALPYTSPDAALLPVVTGGAYTAQVAGKGTAAGVSLVEIYDASTAAAPRLTNLSVLGKVGTGSAILVVGFALDGSVPKPLLIRAIGPTLAGFGVSGVLPRPQLVLFRQGLGTPLRQNDTWGGGPEFKAAFAAAGAFALPDASRDAALLMTLEPGIYTVQVSGADNATGAALVEVYEAR